MVETRVLEDLQNAFNNGEYVQVISRVDRILSLEKKRKSNTAAPTSTVTKKQQQSSTKSNPKQQQIFSIRDQIIILIVLSAKAAALTQLSRFDDALTTLDRFTKELQTVINSSPKDIVDQLSTSIQSGVDFNKAYALYGAHQLDKALFATQSLPKSVPESSVFPKHLEAQILYRSGNYAESCKKYSELMNDAKDAVKVAEHGLSSATESSRKKSGWSLSTGSTQQDIDKQKLLLQDAELALSSAVAFATDVMVNNLASQLLVSESGAFNAQLLIKSIVEEDSNESLGVHAKQSFEFLYNAATACLRNGNISDAIELLLSAERSAISDAVEDEGISASTVPVPVIAQRAYALQLQGELTDSIVLNKSVIENRSVDPATLAVASNNLACAYECSELVNGGSEKATTNLLDLAKRMKVTSLESLERQLNVSQKHSFGLNRALIFLRMGRIEMARMELSKLEKLNFHDTKAQVLVLLTSISLSLSHKKLEEANQLVNEFEKQHSSSNDEDLMTICVCARAQICVNTGNFAEAASILLNSSLPFAKQVATVLSAAKLLERASEYDRLEVELEKFVSTCIVEDAKSQLLIYSALADALRRCERWNQAAKHYTTALEISQRIKSNDETDILSALIYTLSYIEGSETSETSVEYTAKLAAILGESRGKAVGIDGEDEMEIDVKLMDGSVLENMPIPKRRGDRSLEVNVESVSVGATKVKAKKKRKRRLPKGYEADWPPPDPERWLPKYMRAGYKKKKKQKQDNIGKGTQGGDLSSTAAFSDKQDRAAAAARERIDDGERIEAPVRADQRPKGAKKKAKRRK